MNALSSNRVIPLRRPGAPGASPTTDERDFDATSPLRDVIAALLALVLPAPQHEMIPQLTGIVAACKGVAEHRGKRWGDLTEAEENAVAHKVGALAREILGTGRAGGRKAAA